LMTLFTFLSTHPHPHYPTLFPYTTLFRSLARSEGPIMLQHIRNVEHDINNPADDFHSQTALLEKINVAAAMQLRVGEQTNQFLLDRKSTRLNSSHLGISYAVFCLKKKKRV